MVAGSKPSEFSWIALISGSTDPQYCLCALLFTGSPVRLDGDHRRPFYSFDPLSLIQMELVQFKPSLLFFKKSFSPKLFWPTKLNQFGFLRLSLLNRELSQRSCLFLSLGQVNCHPLLCASFRCAFFTGDHRSFAALRWFRMLFSLSLGQPGHLTIEPGSKAKVNSGNHFINTSLQERNSAFTSSWPLALLLLCAVNWSKT